MKVFSFSRRERGVALVTTLAIILTLMVLGGALIFIALGENRISRQLEVSKKAFYIADGGIEYGQYKLQNSGEILDDYDPEKVHHLGDDGYFTLEFDYAGSEITLISNGYYGNTHRQLMAKFIAGVTFEDLDVGVFSEGIIDIGGNSEIDSGKILSNSSITVRGGAKFIGNVEIGSKTGEIDCDLDYTLIDDFPGITFPEICWTTAQEMSAPPMEGNIFQLGDDPKESYYHNGTLELSGHQQIRGKGILFIDGDLRLEGHASIGEPDDNIVLVVRGDVRFAGPEGPDDRYFCTIISEGSIEVKGSINGRGSFISREQVVIEGNIEFEFGFLEATDITRFTLPAGITMTYWGDA